MAIKFPDPSERSAKEPAVICDDERVLALYNRATGDNKVRMSKNVKTWFVNEADKRGWDAARFVNNVETRFSAGCLLYKGPEKILVGFAAGEGSEGDDDE
ncbi:hypothetical protein P7D22_22470 [Lichenihabitans sp. Uapishka_5]|uniref:hypothetical protein n=1 Tax=Lichenihabitans sp. Uapishka_5 TaxID=3037302 RepID=UPI0029E7DF1F|nr:hypothetical protein [Lichenihabitans sp. Uapishka_5]MDX7953923.1 hypothetical protein [Lichenihabitans sp. Uapishka_5]